MENKGNKVFWSVVVLGVPIIAVMANWDKIKIWIENRPQAEQGRDTPLPPWPAVPVAPKPTVTGRWVSTEFANEILELGPLGEAKITYRGQQSPYTGRYEYSADVLKLIVDWPPGPPRTVENRILSLNQGEMTLLLPRLIGIREERRVTYWRIDPQNYSPLRAQLIGKWQATGPFHEVIEFAADDTTSATLNGRQYVGIYRVVGQTLEYHLNTEPATPITRMTVETVADTNLSLVSPFNNKRADYKRLRDPN